MQRLSTLIRMLPVMSCTSVRNWGLSTGCLDLPWQMLPHIPPILLRLEPVDAVTHQVCGDAGGCHLEVDMACAADASVGYNMVLSSDN